MPTRTHTLNRNTTAPEIELPPDAATAEDHRNPRRRRRQEEEPAPEVGLLTPPEPLGFAYLTDMPSTGRTPPTQFAALLQVPLPAFHVAMLAFHVAMFA